MKNTLETRLGIFFALALIVAVILLEMIGAADFFKRGYPISGIFKNAQELKKGDLVKMAGVEIGRVEDVGLEGNRARVNMKIKGSQVVKIDSKAFIRFTGLMGQNYIAIEGGTDDAPRAQPGATLETGEQPDLSVLMTKLEGVASGVEGLTKSFSTDNLSSLLGPVTDFMKQNQGNLTMMISNFKVISDNIAGGKGTVGKVINDDALYTAAYGTVTNLQASTADLKNLMAKVEGMIGTARSVIDGIGQGNGTLGKLAKDEALYSETTAMVKSLREISDKMNRGQGTVGQLINDDGFLKNAKLSLQKLDKATEGLEDQGPLSVLGIAIGGLF